MSEEVGDEVQKQPCNNWGRGDDEGGFGTSPCVRLWDQCIIISSGAVTLCCSDFNARYAFGNVMEAPLLEIWNSPERQRILGIHQDRRRDELNLCDACDIPELLPLMKEFPKKTKETV